MSRVVAIRSPRVPAGESRRVCGERAMHFSVVKRLAIPEVVRVPRWDLHRFRLALLLWSQPLTDDAPGQPQPAKLVPTIFGSACRTWSDLQGRSRIGHHGHATWEVRCKSDKLGISLASKPESPHMSDIRDKFWGRLGTSLDTRSPSVLLACARPLRNPTYWYGFH